MSSQILVNKRVTKCCVSLQWDHPFDSFARSRNTATLGKFLPALNIRLPVQVDQFSLSQRVADHW